MNRDFNYEISSDDKKAILRKLDMHLLPLLMLLYLLSFLDRVNIGNVHSSIQKYKGITESQYASIVGIFFVGYIMFEIPSNLVMKKMKPSRWIARIMVSWGVISTCMAWANSYSSLLICRSLLGVSESGFFPGILYYLTFWYPSEERALRIAFFFCAAAIAGIFGGFVAFAILKNMENVLGMHAYQWVFILEGIPSIIFGIFTWFFLPDFPSTATFLNDHEKNVLAMSLEQSETSTLSNKSTDQSVHGKSKVIQTMSSDKLSEDTNPKVQMLEKENSKFIHFAAIKATVLSSTVWFFAFLNFCLVTPLYCSAFFLPALLGKLGLSPIISNLLTVPLYAVATVISLLWSRHSDFKKERALHLAGAALTGASGFLGLAIWGSDHTHFALAYISAGVAILGVYPTTPCLLAWLTNTTKVSKTIEQLLVSSNCTHTKSVIQSSQMATQTALVVCFANTGGIIGPHIFAASLNRVGSYWIAHVCMATLLIVAAIASACEGRRKNLFITDFSKEANTTTLELEVCPDFSDQIELV